MKKLLFFLGLIPIVSFGQELIEDNYNPYSVIVDDIIIEKYTNQLKF
tara:strand:- start:81 stop:221 length:141 start_codon:yes stop_codon:yes gene_type:complete